MQNGESFLGEKHGKIAHWAKIIPGLFSISLWILRLQGFHWIISCMIVCDLHV